MLEPAQGLSKNLKNIHLNVSSASGSLAHLGLVTRDEWQHPSYQTVLSGPWQLLIVGMVVSPEGRPVWGRQWPPWPPQGFVSLGQCELSWPGWHP